MMFLVFFKSFLSMKGAELTLDFVNMMNICTLYNYSVFFFMLTKVFVHLNHLKLPQISQPYLKFIVWSGHLKKNT